MQVAIMVLPVVRVGAVMVRCERGGTQAALNAASACCDWCVV